MFVCSVQWTVSPPERTVWRHNSSSISFRGPRPGVSLIVDKSEVTTVQLLILAARHSDSGRYTCSPDNAPSASLALHVLTGNWDNDDGSTESNHPVSSLDSTAHCSLFRRQDGEAELREPGGGVDFAPAGSLADCCQAPRSNIDGQDLLNWWKATLKYLQ